MMLPHLMRPSGALLLLTGLLSACAVGPNYHRPAAPTESAYKENQGWKPATPGQVAADAPWWSVYQDAALDELERQIDISNQTLKAAEANYLAARAAVGIDRGTLLPSITATGAETKNGGNSPLAAMVAQPAGPPGAVGVPVYTAEAEADWQIDVWGRIRRTVEGDVARAQASAADVAAARLSAQTTLAEDYFQLRAAEQQQRLLHDSIGAFQSSLDIARARVQAGVATLADVYEASTVLENTQAQAVGAELARAKFEHAIAVLVGKTPSTLSLAPGAMPSAVPVVPADLPASLLERRPDVAAAERNVASANAAVGVATAAWFPSLTLSGSYGYASTVLSSLLRAGNSVWALGPSLAETVFNGGARIAQNSQARAEYDSSVAGYRATALGAFQQVEDDLASLRVLEQQGALQDLAVQDAHRSEDLTLSQYKAGVTDYTAVITAQTTRLSSEINALNIQSQRLVASVDLITALGGGWDARQLPQPGVFYHLSDSAQPAPAAR
jgi:NodT family efflux transporter outer membrane factor (OMF) lipoprotein